MNDPYQMRQHFDPTHCEVIEIVRKLLKQKINDQIDSTMFPSFERLHYDKVYGILKGCPKPPQTDFQDVS